MIINHNLSAINSHRVLKFQNEELSKNMEKLSSGMRINRGGDDASGLAVSEKMRTQVAGLRQAERNTEDGMSMIQTTEGYLNELSELLQRIRVLGVQSSNGIYTAEDRQMMQVEVSQLIDEVDRDFVFLLNAYDIDPGAYTPKVMTMLDFNLWSWNSRIFPGIDSLNVRLGDKVRIRIGNLTMTNHPIHLHGHEFVVTGTDGGPTPKAARWPEVTTDVAVGQMRQIEFLADEPGDWAIHCHKSHHTMNAMGHNVPTMIGVDHRDVAGKINKLIPDYMVMGERGMKDMTEMEMPLPDNTAAMMTGQGPFGSVGMGGMFSVVKVRKGQKRGDYGDPGWFKHPAGTVAYEFTGELPDPARFKAEGTGSMPPVAKPAQEVEVKVRKPGGGHGGHN